MRHTSMFLSLSLITTLAAIPACDSSEDVPAIDIRGGWLSACLVQPQADGSTSYILLDFDIAEEAWALDYTVHGDAACSASARLLTVHIEGPYELGAPSATVPGAHEGVFHFAEKTITPHVQPLADMLNGLDGCGSGSWEVGVTQDVLATGCAGLGQYPEATCSADYDLVSVDDDGDALQLGARPANNDMCSPEKRPTALNPAALSRKQ